VIVHCSAGIGRTGTLIAVYNIIESLKYSMHSSNFEDIVKMENNLWVEDKKKNWMGITNQSLCPLRVSVFGTVRKMREQRMGMIKNPEQYSFIYKYIQRWVINH